MDEVDLPPTDPRCRHAWHLYILRLSLPQLKIDREEFMRRLRHRGIGASVHFIPIPLHPFFEKLPLARNACPRALDLYQRIVSLPLYPDLTEDEVHYVAQSVREIVESSRRVKFIRPGSPVTPISIPA
jgi:dTDP-4-amino-4,6-dideoxygalactose transaminase